MRVFFLALTLISSTLAMEAHLVSSSSPDGVSSSLSSIEQAVVKFFLVRLLLNIVKVLYYLERLSWYQKRT